MFRHSFKCCVVLLSGAGLVGCESKAGTGALMGGGGGAAAGAIIGHQSGHGGEGALIGGALGAIGGGLVGNSMDERDKREAAERERDAYAQDYDRRHAGGANSWSTSRERHDVTQIDVIRWTERGVRDDIIIDRIERSATVFHLSAADQNDLRDEGVSEDVIRAMKDTARR
jgi:surface antigen